MARANSPMKQIAETHKIYQKRLSVALLIVVSLPSFGGEKTPARCEMTVPYVQQIRNYCGPASLCSVLQFWGVAVDQKSIGKSVFDSSLQATNGADMLLYARGKGFSAYSWNSSVSDLKDKLAPAFR